MQIELTPVESSRIAAIGYSSETFTLAIKFSPTKKAPAGKVYHYEGVAPEQFEDFHEAESKGGWFQQNILNKPEHPYSCVDQGEGVDQPEASKPADPVYLEAVPVPELKELPEDEEGLKSRALEVKETATSLQIRTPEAYALAGNQLKEIVSERKRAQERVDAIKKPAYATYQAALQLEHDVIDRYTQAEKVLRSSMARYLAEEERERLRKEAELRRQKEEEARKEAEREARERAQQEASVLIAQGEPEGAAQVLSNPLPVVPKRVAPVILQTEVPKVAGVSSRKNWNFRIVDESLLTREYLMPNESAIRQVVKALKDKATISGVEVYCEDNIAVRA